MKSAMLPVQSLYPAANTSQQLKQRARVPLPIHHAADFKVCIKVLGDTNEERFKLNILKDGESEDWSCSSSSMRYFGNYLRCMSKREKSKEKRTINLSQLPQLTTNSVSTSKEKEAVDLICTPKKTSSSSILNARSASESSDEIHTFSTSTMQWMKVVCPTPMPSRVASVNSAYIRRKVLRRQLDQDRTAKPDPPQLSELTGVVVVKESDSIFVHFRGTADELSLPANMYSVMKVGNWVHVKLQMEEDVWKILKVEVVDPLHLSIPTSEGVLVMCTVKVPPKEQFALSTWINSEISDYVIDTDNCIPLINCSQSIRVVLQYQYREGDPHGFWLIVRVV